jgi:hypothetical protein
MSYFLRRIPLLGLIAAIAAGWVAVLQVTFPAPRPDYTTQGAEGPQAPALVHTLDASPLVGSPHQPQITVLSEGTVLPALSGQGGRGPSGKASPAFADPRGERIRELKVQIWTAEGVLTGPQDLPLINLSPESRQTNNVYLDLGPVAFPLGNDFRAGSVYSAPLAESPSGRPLGDLALYTSDIVMAGLRKHGILDFHNAPDSWFDHQSDLQGKVKQCKYDLDVAQKAFDEAKRVFDALVNAGNAVNQKIDDFQRDLSATERSLGELQRQLDGKISEEINKVLPEKIPITKSVPKPWKPWEKEEIKLGEIPNPMRTPEAVARLKEKLIKELSGAVKAIMDQIRTTQVKIENLKASIAKHAKEKVAETAKKAADDTRAAAEKALIAARNLHGEFEKVLGEVNAIVKTLPKLPFDLPKPGEWEPAKLVLLVNGKPFLTWEVNERLKRGHASCMRLLKPLSPAEQLAHRLRVEMPKQGEGWAEKLAILTTRFKVAGISGWDDSMPVKTARVVGCLKRPPSVGTDNCVSLDLQVERLEAAGQSIELDGKRAVAHTRFVRIEYVYCGVGRTPDERFKTWQVGDRFEASGAVRFDTDGAGHLEIHPGGPAEIKVVSR